jgi:hypothetical protein
MPTKQASIKSIRAIIGSSFSSVALHRSECEDIVDYMYEDAKYSDISAGQILPEFIDGWTDQVSKGNNPTKENVENILKQLVDMSSDEPTAPISEPQAMPTAPISEPQAISFSSFIGAIDPQFSELIQSVTRTVTGFSVEFKQ